VDVKVDEAGKHQPIAGVDDLLPGSGREPVPELEDAVAVQPDVAAPVKPLTRVDDDAATDQHAHASAARSIGGPSRAMRADHRMSGG
jgi:hypothetical protein